MASASRNMSLYIPVVFNHTTTSVIVETFTKLNLGQVHKVDRVPVMAQKVNEEGVIQRWRTHDQAFVHLHWCTDSVAAMNLYEKLAVDGGTAKLMYNDPYYWALYKNRNPEQSVIREQGTQITELQNQVSELKELITDLSERVNTLEGYRQWENNNSGWDEAIASPLWNAHEVSRGASGTFDFNLNQRHVTRIESLEPWEGEDLPDPFHHCPSRSPSPSRSRSPSPSRSPIVSPTPEEVSNEASACDITQD